MALKPAPESWLKCNTLDPTRQCVLLMVEGAACQCVLYVQSQERKYTIKGLGPICSQDCVLDVCGSVSAQRTYLLQILRSQSEYGHDPWLDRSILKSGS